MREYVVAWLWRGRGAAWRGVVAFRLLLRGVAWRVPDKVGRLAKPPGYEVGGVTEHVDCQTK